MCGGGEEAVGGFVDLVLLIYTYLLDRPIGTRRIAPSGTNCVMGMKSVTPSFRVRLASKRGIGLSSLHNGIIVLRFATD